MNQRERILTIVVGALLTIIGVFWIIGKVNSTFRVRNAALEQVQNEIAGKQQFVAKARQTVKKLAEYEDMSLPSDQELARSQYQAWLSEIVDRAGLVEPQVKVVAQSRLANGATQLTCSVNGLGDLRQLTTLLHEFYCVNTIHRIRRLPLRPQADSKQIKIDLRVEALILPTANKEKDFDIAPSSPLAALSSEELIDPIIQRNMFSPANNPPTIRTVSTQRVARGKPLSLSLRAEDPDKLDNLKFSLGADAPQAARVDADGGRLEWTPAENGKYTFTVLVRDDGIPSKQAEQLIEVDVVDPSLVAGPAGTKQLAFDDARFTYAIAMLEVSGQRQLWLQIRTSGQILKLNEGDSVRVGSIDAKIARIGQRDVELDANGERIFIRVGEPLVGANVVGEGGL
jgi:hypothetical protein